MEDRNQMDATGLKTKHSSASSRLSWFDYLLARIDRFPGSGWWLYLGLGIVLLLLLSALSWFEGVVPPGKFLVIHIFLSALFPFFLFVTGSLNRSARSALDTMRPVLDLDEGQLHHWQDRLTRMPSIPVLLASLVALGTVFLIEAIGGEPYHVEVMEGFPLSSMVLRLLYLASWCFFGAYIHHTMHQLNLVNGIYTRHTRINLFRKSPLYGLSSLTAISAVSMIVPPYGFVLINPSIKISDPIILVLYGFITCIAVATFLWPQVGINRLQRREKTRLLDDANQRYELLLVELHTRIDHEAFDQVAALNPGFALIEAELKRIKGTPTWPWQPETLRWFISALVSPLLVWLLQNFLPQILGR